MPPAETHWWTLYVSTSGHFWVISMVGSTREEDISRQWAGSWELSFWLHSPKRLCEIIRSHKDWNMVWCVVEGSSGDRIITETPDVGVRKRWLGSWSHCLPLSEALQEHSGKGRNHDKGIPRWSFVLIPHTTISYVKMRLRQCLRGRLWIWQAWKPFPGVLLRGTVDFPWK